jgi:hypothetical protein
MIVTPAAKLAPKLAEKIDAAMEPIVNQVIDDVADAVPAQPEQPAFGGVRPASDRVFGFVMSGFFALIAAWPLRHGLPVRAWGFIVAAGFLTVTLIYPPLLASFNRVWTALGAIMHAVMTPVVLAVMFFGVLTPVSFAMRLFGRDALELRLDPAAKSYWKTREPGPTPESMSQQF